MRRNIYQAHGESLYIASGKECEHTATVPDALTDESYRSKWANTEQLSPMP